MVATEGMITRMSVRLVLLALFVTGCQSSEPMDERTMSVVEMPDGWSAEYAQFSPNSERLAVLAFDSRARLRVGLVVGTEIHSVATQGRLTDFAWMPSSTEFLAAFGGIMRPAHLEVVDLNGQSKRVIELSMDIELTQRGMAVAPNGQRVVVSAQPLGGRSNPEDLFEIDLDSGAVRQLTNTPDTVEVFPVWRGGDVVFTELRDHRTSSNLAIMSGGVVDWLTEGDIWFDRAAIDGAGQVYAAGFPASSPLQWQIYRVEEGSTSRVDSPGPPVHWLTVRPDGRQIAGTDAASPGSSGRIVVWRLRGVA